MRDDRPDWRLYCGDCGKRMSYDQTRFRWFCPKHGSDDHIKGLLRPQGWGICGVRDCFLFENEVQVIGVN